VKIVKYILLLIVLLGIIITVLVLSFRWRSEEVYNKISIIGNYTISDKEILKYAGLDGIQNVKSENLNENEIAEKLKLHPDIKKVFVVKNPPNEIKIEIIEKNPIALVNINGELNFIDEELDLQPLKNTGKVYDLPIINGIRFEKDKLLERNTKSELKIAISILMAINKESKLLSDMISEINMSDKENIILYTHDYSIPILIPKYKEELFQNIDVRRDVLIKIKAMKYFLEEIYPNEKKEDIEKINLTYSNQLIITFKE